MASGRAVAYEPWRLSGKVKANAASATLEKCRSSTGPSERAATLAGAAEFKFGAKPQLQGTLSARQIDLDRLLATPETPRRAAARGGAGVRRNARRRAAAVVAGAACDERRWR